MMKKRTRLLTVQKARANELARAARRWPIIYSWSSLTDGHGTIADLPALFQALDKAKSSN